MKKVSKYLPLWFGISSVSIPYIEAQNESPNIIFILADDLGWNDLHCTGSDFYESPNIDCIAQNGIRFMQGYSTCSVSSPSRASILTGKFPARHGVTNFIGPSSGEEWRKTGRFSKLLPPEYRRSLPHEEV
ncbi:MAG: sulfatase-like hydrolase/transferase, partial [Dysgonamonadaceae bacterium]|nr:sulfatase-like hydrolase/transferase [Dysgonamonadaceae bacterium]